MGHLKSMAHKLHVPHFTTDSLLTDLIGMMGNRADAASFLKDHTAEWLKNEKDHVFFLLKKVLSFDHHHDDDDDMELAAAETESCPPDQHDANEQQPDKKRKEKKKNLISSILPGGIKKLTESSHSGGHGANKEEPTEAAGPSTKRAKEEAQEDEEHQIISLRWLRRVLKSDGINILHNKTGPRFLAIVTPPVDIKSLEDEDLHEHRRGTEIAKRVCEHFSRPGSRFDFTVWVNAAERHSQTTDMLQDILQQVKKQAQEESSSSSHDRDDVGGKTTTTTTTMGDDKAAVLRDEIAKHLKGKKYLIFLANQPQDDTSWTQILTALPTDSSHATVVLTPLVQQAYQYIGWFTLSLLFLIRHSRYRVYFYSHLVATMKKAKELIKASSEAAHAYKHQDLQGCVDKILTTCRWDSFSTKMFLHALNANPHRTTDDLERLNLHLSEFSTVSNAVSMIGFCYDDLPNHYKVCFLYLSIFPSESEFRRTSLVRRWATEGLVVGRDGLAAIDEAELCFNELVDRGLLLPANDTENPTGKVKICKVHPHVLSFMARIPRDDGHAAGDSVLLPPALAHRLSIPSGIHLSKRTRQASEGLKKQMEKQMDLDGDVVMKQDTVENMVKLLSLFRTRESGWIKVLDLEGYHGLTKKHLKEICNKIFQLRYLSLRNTGIAELPKEINKLQDLETFDIRETNIEHFPSKSIVLPKLAQLLSGHHIDKETTGASSHGSFTAVDIPHGIGSMTNMQVLSHVRVGDGSEEAALDMVRLQMLRKLGVVINGKQASLLLKVVGMLSECLMSLSIHISSGSDMVPDLNKEPKIFSPPRSLASLSIRGKVGGLPKWLLKMDQLSDITLCETYLKESDITILGALINLRFIRLLSDSCDTKKLTFGKGFRSLEFLTVQGSDISAIFFEKRVAPKLEKIVWSSICKMKTLGIHSLQGLKEIELHGDYDGASIRESIKSNPNNPVLKYMKPAVSVPPANHL
ncbi:unnamed protein product [Urochloa humidicola]